MLPLIVVTLRKKTRQTQNVINKVTTVSELSYQLLCFIEGKGRL